MGRIVVPEFVSLERGPAGDRSKLAELMAADAMLRPVRAEEVAPAA